MAGKLLRAVLNLLVILVVAAVYFPLNAQTRTDQAPTVTKDEAPKAAPAGAPDSGNAAAVDPRTYVIGAEDVLQVKVWREPDFTSQYIVRPDGKITIPLVGDVQASGLTPDRLSNQLEQALSDYLNKPQVTVSLAQVNSKKFFVTGQVYKPGEFPLVVPTRIFDALTNAGGFRDFANKKKIIIIRGAERIKFNYQEILKGRNLDQNILLQNGDTIVVP